MRYLLWSGSEVNAKLKKAAAILDALQGRPSADKGSNKTSFMIINDIKWLALSTSWQFGG
jgi:hypothetical protein